MPNNQAELDTEYEDADLPAHARETLRFHLKLLELLLLERKKLLSQMVSTRRWWTRPIWINRTQESFSHTVAPTPATWKFVAQCFQANYNFPNCIGAVAGKHIQIRAPSNSGSLYHNSKGTFSIVFMAVCDSDLQFVVVDVGAIGRQSNGGTVGVSRLGKFLKDGKLGLPPPEIPPGTHTQAPRVFVGDDAFQLREDFLKPYLRRQLSSDKRIFNHSLSRARRQVILRGLIRRPRPRRNRDVEFDGQVVGSLDSPNRILLFRNCE
ncbi:hypothetical protein HPB51_028161 [Rhipicephalus microplus]|uniref:DDE Tnp4 domain-containing protein n=1 Tax=Rhipicephalus microplus TaxID=6941 RepID=A0A9J6CY77_RHIMP|nr:hypothetical protein HPB51_028161 [Rhipicephalus microplus]